MRRHLYGKPASVRGGGANGNARGRGGHDKYLLRQIGRKDEKEGKGGKLELHE